MFRQLQMAASGDLRMFALLLFFTLFVAVLVRFFVLRRREDFVRLSRLPLEREGERHEGAGELAP